MKEKTLNILKTLKTENGLTTKLEYKNVNNIFSAQQIHQNV